jgi:hypothetical protein
MCLNHCSGPKWPLLLPQWASRRKSVVVCKGSAVSTPAERNGGHLGDFPASELGTRGLGEYSFIVYRAGFKEFGDWVTGVSALVMKRCS